VSKKGEEERGEKDGAVERGFADRGISFAEECEDFIIGVSVEIVGHRWQKGTEEAVFVKQVEEGFRRARFKHAEELFENSRGGTFENLLFTPQKRLESGAIDVEVEAGAKFNEADHPDGVLDKTDVGLADRAEDPFFKVGIASDVIDDGLVFDVVKKAVDGEIAAEDIFLLGSPYVVSDDQVGYASVSRTEGGNFNDFLAKPDMRQPESAADQDRVAEKGPDLFGLGGSGDIEIFGALLEQEVAYAAADEIGLMARLAELQYDVGGIGIDFIRGYLVFVDWVYFWLHVWWLHVKRISGCKHKRHCKRFWVLTSRGWLLFAGSR